MFRFILNYNQPSHTISAIITPADAGDILACAVLTYKEDSPGKAEDLKHLEQYGFHHSSDIEVVLGPKEANIIRQGLGALIHGSLEAKVEKLGIKAHTTWEMLDSIPSFTSDEGLTYDQATEICARALNLLQPPAND